ncbi:MAG: isoprenylcysteine carboxylmethyltransferase family protein [Chitinophagales bacterium]|nr:isoprenylcysteine carboxylmethyltransferase family protein [Chitinophagales bacterium]
MPFNEYMLMGMWMLFGIIHSITAHDSCKNFVQRHFPLIFNHYRKLYNIIAVITLSATCLVHFAIASSPLPFPGKSALGGGIIMLLGIFIVIKVLIRYDARAFLGFSTSKETKTEFVTDGLSEIVRHPMYVGTLLIMVGFLIVEFQWKTLMTISILFGYLQIGIYFEEKKLVREFGEDYLQYKKKTPKLLLFNPLKFIQHLL